MSSTTWCEKWLSRDVNLADLKCPEILLMYLSCRAKWGEDFFYNF